MGSGLAPLTARSASPVWTVADRRSAGTRRVAGERREPPTTLRSACDAAWPAGEAWAVRLGWSSSSRVATQDRLTKSRTILAGSSTAAAMSAAAYRPPVAAHRPLLGRARRAPMRCRHVRCPFLPGDVGACGTIAVVHGDYRLLGWDDRVPGKSACAACDTGHARLRRSLMVKSEWALDHVRRRYRGMSLTGGGENLSPGQARLTWENYGLGARKITGLRPDCFQCIGSSNWLWRT